MRTRQKAQLTWLRGVSEFLDSYAAFLPRLAESTLRTRLHEVVEELDGLLAVQDCSITVRSISARYRLAREALERDLMIPLVAIARLEVNDVRLLETFRIPRGTAAETFVKAVRAMARVAEPYEAAFIAAGMPVDFREELYNRSDAIMANRAERNRVHARGFQATMLVSQWLSDGRRLANVLEGLVSADVANDPCLRTVWSNVRHMPRIARRAVA